MLQKLLSFIFIFASFSLFAQDIERVRVEGKVVVPEGDDPEGITIYNESSKRGTITNEEGEFGMAVAENDSISFSAIQFQRFTVVVDEGVVESGEMNVFIRETVTELPEVVVLPHDLSGNINVDVNRIRVSDADLPNYSAAELERMGVRVEPDSLTGPGRNEALAASQTWLIHGLDFVNIFKAIVGADMRPREISQREMDRYVRRMYSDDFFSEYLDIERESINDFIYYATDNGLTAELMEEGNELDLVHFLIERSQEYRQLREEN